MKPWAEVSKFKFSELISYIHSVQHYAKVFMKPHPVTINPCISYNSWDGFNSTYVSKNGYSLNNHGLISSLECTINHLKSLYYITNAGYTFACIDFGDEVKTLDDLSTYTPSYQQRVIVPRKGTWKATNLPFWVLIVPLSFSKPLFGDFVYCRTDSHPFGAIVCEDAYGAPDFRTARLISFSQLISVFNCKPIARYTSEVKSLPTYKELQEIAPTLYEDATIVRSRTNENYGAILAASENPEHLILKFIADIKSYNYDGKFLAYALTSIRSRYKTLLGEKLSQIAYLPLNAVFDFGGQSDSYGIVSITKLDTGVNKFKVTPETTILTLPIKTKDDLLAIYQLITAERIPSNHLLNLVFLFGGLLNPSPQLSSRDPLTWMSAFSSFVNIPVNLDESFKRVLSFMKNKQSAMLFKPAVQNKVRFGQNTWTVNELLASKELIHYSPDENSGINIHNFFVIAGLNIKISSLQGYPYGCKVYLRVLYSYSLKPVLVDFELIFPNIFLPFININIIKDKTTRVPYSVSGMPLLGNSIYTKLVAEHSPSLNEPNPYLPYLSQYGLDYFGTAVYAALASLFLSTSRKAMKNTYTDTIGNQLEDAVMSLDADMSLRQEIIKLNKKGGH